MKDIGQKYIHGHQQSVLASHGQRTAANSCAYFLPLLNKDMSLLDVGCGPGTISADLAEHVREVVGLDIAPISRSVSAKNLRFCQADIQDYEDGPFDVVHAHQVLQHLSDPVAALKKMGELATQFLAIREADYQAMVWYPESRGMDLWRELYIERARGLGGEPNAGRYLKAWAHEAGFKDFEITTSTWTYATPAETKWWGDSQARRMRESQWVEMGHVEEIASAWEEWGRHPDAYFCMPHTEIIIRCGKGPHL